jgi:ABC-type lipopolysaccharide export system ATPase subunit
MRIDQKSWQTPLTRIWSIGLYTCKETVILSNGEIQATVSSKELGASAEVQNYYLGVA